MNNETKAVCPKCGAEADNTSDSWPQFKCLSMCGPNGEMMIQTDACTIASLTQQLADANKEVDRLRRACSQQQSNICQTLGKALGYPRFGDLPEVCDDPANDDICVFEHVAETLADEAVRNLADARLLAKVRNSEPWVCWWRDALYIVDPHIGTTRHVVEFSDGLPILTPEIRTALRKATGEV